MKIKSHSEWYAAKMYIKRTLRYNTRKNQPPPAIIFYEIMSSTVCMRDRPCRIYSRVFLYCLSNRCDVTAPAKRFYPEKTERKIEFFGVNSRIDKLKVNCTFILSAVSYIFLDMDYYI